MTLRPTRVFTLTASTAVAACLGFAAFTGHNVGALLRHDSRELESRRRKRPGASSGRTRSHVHVSPQNNETIRRELPPLLTSRYELLRAIDVRADIDGVRLLPGRPHLDF